MLVTLELAVGREIRILVVEVNDIADRDEGFAIVAEVIEEAAAIAVLAHDGPAERVLHETFLENLFRNRPDFF